MTVPAPQAAALLGVEHALHDRIAGVIIAPCLTLMAAFPKGSPRPFPSRSCNDQPLAWIAQDNSKPGRAGALTTWVAQASGAWSEQHLEDTPDVIAARMLPMLAEVIGVAPQLALYAAAHRWRYARTTAPLGEPFLSSDDGTLHVGGDWCLGARVEAAWSSGTATADAIIERTGSI
ncbi:MAG: FAD-dependent oxidoreductase [Sandarakinorhabdus sp.]|nr:FAD-dependent oxidoreductase [Sandarakinorhabdus sp.]